MSYNLCIPADIGTPGLALKAALSTASPLVPHATIRDLAVGEIGQGFYELRTSLIPYGYLGAVYFYTGTLSAATVWTGVAIQAVEGSQLLTMLAAIKAAVRLGATVNGDQMLLEDGAIIEKDEDGNRIVTEP